MHDVRDMEKMAERNAAKPVNRYDKDDVVRRVFLMNAEGLKFASYRVRDMIALHDHNRDMFSSLQHHLTYVPVKSFGDRMMVSEIGATIYAMLEDEQVAHLEEVMLKIETNGLGQQTFVDLDVSHTVIQAYQRPGDDVIEFQITRGPQVLGIMPWNVAKTFCTLAERARSGGPSMADASTEAPKSKQPVVDLGAAIAGEVDKALSEPGEAITFDDRHD